MTLPAGLTEADVERAARAAFENDWGDGTFDKTTDGERECWKRGMRAALTAAIGGRVVVEKAALVEVREALDELCDIVEAVSVPGQIDSFTTQVARAASARIRDHEANL